MVERRFCVHVTMRWFDVSISTSTASLGQQGYQKIGIPRKPGIPGSGIFIVPSKFKQPYSLINPWFEWA